MLLVQNAQREVSVQDGEAFARRHGCLFLETSAKTNEHVGQAFEELCLKMLEQPSLMADVHAPGLQMRAQQNGRSSSCC